MWSQPLPPLTPTSLPQPPFSALPLLPAQPLISHVPLTLTQTPREEKPLHARHQTTGEMKALSDCDLMALPWTSQKTEGSSPVHLADPRVLPFTSSQDQALKTNPSAFKPTATPFGPAKAQRLRADASAMKARDVAGTDGTNVATSPMPPAQELSLPSHLASIQLFHYASLCAECTLYPAHLAATRARYGVSGEAEHRLLDGHWLAKLAAQSKLMAEWKEAYDRYEKWLLEQNPDV